jgi:uncharacterized protein YkwD
VAPLAAIAALLAGCTHPPAARDFPQRDPAFDQVISLERFDNRLLSRAIFWESNRVRVANGVPALKPLPALDGAADEQATYMALILRASHGNPIPREHNAAERVTHVGLHPERVAENAIMMPALRDADVQNRDYTYAEYATYLLDGWMNSPGHRINMLDPGFAYLGCAARLAHGITHGDQRIFATQVFFLPDPSFSSVD